MISQVQSQISHICSCLPAKVIVIVSLPKEASTLVPSCKTLMSEALYSQGKGQSDGLLYMSIMFH